MELLENFFFNALVTKKELKLQIRNYIKYIKSFKLI